MPLGVRGSQLDYWVDRLDVEVRTLRRMKLTSTNKPITCSHFLFASTMRFPSHDRDVQVLYRQLDSVSAAIATGKRPAPFRTRKLSPSAPMVLPW